MPTQEEAQAALEVLTAFVNDGASEAAAEETTAVTIPPVEEVEALDKDAVRELCGQLGITTDEVKSAILKTHLTTLATINADENPDAEDLNDLAEALGITPDKKASKTQAAVKEWIEALGSAPAAEEETPAEETTAEPAAEETTEGTAEEPAAEETPATDNVDREAVVAKVKKFPDVKTMIAQMTAYNKAATEEIEFDAKKPLAGYKQYLETLVDSEGVLAGYNTVYVRDGMGWGSGLPLEDLAIKGVKNPGGKDQVTGKLYVLNEEGTGFDPYVLKKK